MIVELIYLKIKFSRILFENFCLLMDTLLLLLIVIFNALSIQIHLKIKLLWSEFFSQVYIILKTFYFCTINIFLKNNFSFFSFLFNVFVQFDDFNYEYNYYQCSIFQKYFSLKNNIQEFYYQIHIHILHKPYVHLRISLNFVSSCKGNVLYCICVFFIVFLIVHFFQVYPFHLFIDFY